MNSHLETVLGQTRSKKTLRKLSVGSVSGNKKSPENKGDIDDTDLRMHDGPW